jgi:hypothetical protein
VNLLDTKQIQFAHAYAQESSEAVTDKRLCLLPLFAVNNCRRNKNIKPPIYVISLDFKQNIAPIFIAIKSIH